MDRCPPEKDLLANNKSFFVFGKIDRIWHNMMCFWGK